MKRTILALWIASVSILTFAQSGGDTENPSGSSGDLKNQFYFRFGYSLPTTSYLGVDDVEFWDYYTRNGATFELGGIFMLNSIPMPDGLRIGINVDYAEFSYHQLSAIDYNQDFGILKIASKVGPTLSYSPASKLVFDLFVKAKIPWVGGIVSFVSDEVDEGFFAKPGIGLATGINVRYRFLMVGFEFNTDNMKFENVDFPGEYFGNFSDDSDKTPMPGFSFTLGFSF